MHSKFPSTLPPGLPTVEAQPPTTRDFTAPLGLGEPNVDTFDFSLQGLNNISLYVVEL
ncbi:MAG: hypothetical protein LM578_06835 [Desulfurococcaceae archaeon]|nr:hypothetical protein [Desulfurococcaceae archaeon]